MKSRRPSRGAKGYQRTDRLRTLLLEILAGELESLEDPALELVFFSSVEVDKDLNRAVVFFSSLKWGGGGGGGSGAKSTGKDGLLGDSVSPKVLAATTAALAEHIPRFRRAMAKQAHIRRVPELVFEPDISFQYGAQIDALLRDIADSSSPSSSSPSSSSASPSTPTSDPAES